jgi:hypothetical protein
VISITIVILALLIIWTKIGIYNKIYFVLICFAHYISYFLCFILNPGIPKHNFRLHNNEYYVPEIVVKYEICYICNFVKDISKNIEHCPYCGVCIEGMYFFHFIF